MGILIKSNFRKNKVTSIGLVLLMLITSMLIGLVCLLFLDACPSSERDGKRLDAGDALIMLKGDLSDLDDAALRDAFSGDVEKYETVSMLCNGNTSVNFGDGTVVTTLYINDHSEFEKELNRSEILMEDTSVTEDYIYLPNQFYTSGGYNTGDKFEFETLGTKSSLTVRGFFDTAYFGCNNTGDYLFVVDDENYSEIREKLGEQGVASATCVFLKDGIKSSKFRISVINNLLAVNPEVQVSVETFENEVFGKTFMGTILAVSFLVMSLILVIVILLMVKSSITNYVRENMKTIGALKSIGYTSGKIRRSMYAMFSILAVAASIVGTALSYVFMPAMAQIVTGQSGVPYSVSFNPVATGAPVIFVILFVLLVTFLSSRRIKKIEAIEALRDGQKSHSFRRNHVRLDKSIFGLNTALAFKTTFRNMKQNLITFFITGLLVFGCVVGYQIYENFGVNPSMKYFTTELADAAINTDGEAKTEVYDYLKAYEGTKNVRGIYMLSLTYKDEDKLFTYAIDDMDKLNNKDVCYEGELPKYDNEVAVSGKFAKDYGYSIGDEVELKYGNNIYRYLITGYVQSTSNLGREGLMSEAAMSRVIDLKNSPEYFYFEYENPDEVNTVIDACKDKYGDHIITTISMKETMEGLMTTFKSISVIMLAVMCVISAAVILLVLFLMVRTLVYNKRKDYGIYKAIGFTSGKLILQTALSFMPTILLSVVVFSFVSYFGANPYMSMMMKSFGMMKCNFPIPVSGVIIIGVAMLLIAFVIAVWQSGRIRRIEAYRMIVGE